MKMTDEINEEAVVDNAVGSRSDITPVDVSEEMRRFVPRLCDERYRFPCAAGRP